MPGRPSRRPPGVTTCACTPGRTPSGRKTRAALGSHTPPRIAAAGGMTLNMRRCAIDQFVEEAAVRDASMIRQAELLWDV